MKPWRTNHMRQGKSHKKGLGETISEAHKGWECFMFIQAGGEKPHNTWDIV
jgi:hypothetical protein